MFDADVAAALEDVDTAERIVRMADDRLVFLAPLEGAEVEDDVVGQVGVVGRECCPSRGLVTCDDVENRSETGVCRERYGRVEQRAVVPQREVPPDIRQPEAGLLVA